MKPWIGGLIAMLALPCRNSIPASLGGGNANVRLKETIVGVSYAWEL